MNLNPFELMTWWRKRRALPRDEHGRVRSGPVREGGEGLLHPKQMTAREKIIALMQANAYGWTTEQIQRLTSAMRTHCDLSAGLVMCPGVTQLAHLDKVPSTSFTGRVRLNVTREAAPRGRPIAGTECTHRPQRR